MLIILMGLVIVSPLFSFPSQAQAQVVNAVETETVREATITDALKAVTGQEPKTESLLPESKQDLSLSQEKTIVKAVEIKGNRSIGVATILAKVKTRVGEEYLQNVIRDDIKRIHNTGYFSDVSVDRENYEGGFKVIFRVTEKPIVEKITFSKTKHYRAPALQQKIKSKAGKFLDNKDLKDDVKTIEDLYTKKGLTQIEVKSETDIDPLTNKAKVHFVIKEGVRIKVQRVLFNGNSSFKSKRLMKIVKTRSAWLFNSGILKEEEFKADVDRIKSFYETEGFIDAKVSSREVSQKGGRIHVVFDIEEGRRYYVEMVSIEGNAVLSDEEILKAMKQIKANSIFSHQKLEEDIREIQTLYFDKGYIFANIKDASSLNQQTGKVEIKLEVTEGEVAYINKIKIQGNDRTRDIVVRRELRLYPGDRFDGEKMRRTKERLRNLGYFDEVNYDIGDTDRSNYKDLVVQVQEAKTGSFSFGGGYSTVDSVVGFVDIEQRNFDFANWPTFTGGGQDLELRAEVGAITNNTRLSFTEPWLFDYPVSGGFDVYMTGHDKNDNTGYAYDEKRVGGDLRLGKELSEYLSGGLTFRREDVKISNLDANVSADLLAEQGKTTITTFGAFLQQDHRDSVINPTRGWYLRESADLATDLLGGDDQFARLRISGAYDVPFKNNSVLEFMVRPGIVRPYGNSDSVPIFERYFAGGANTIRGYDERAIGPRDSVTNDPIGGESLFLANVEYTFPLIDFIKFATFFDTGNVWAKTSDYFSTKLYSGVGFGLRIKTPIAPMKLDYGYPLDTLPGESDRTGQFYFSVSRAF